MSQEFLKEGDAVVICGRDLKRVDAAVKALKTEAPQSQVYARYCIELRISHIFPLIASLARSLPCHATLMRLKFFMSLI